jgi:hypothetical protein
MGEVLRWRKRNGRMQGLAAGMLEKRARRLTGARRERRGMGVGTISFGFNWAAWAIRVLRM